MSFDINIQHRMGDCLIDLQIKTSARVVAICGRSGAGKTTVLNIIAGLIVPDEAAIQIGGQKLCDTSLGVDTPPDQRSAGYAFQDSRLFPNMSVRKNLLFGAKRQGSVASVLEFGEVVSLLGIQPILDRSTKALSGGETRRVAIGRALLSSPKFLLLDEPLTSIDAERRDDLIELLIRIRNAAKMPMLYVSHTQDDVAKIAEETIYLGT